MVVSHATLEFRTPNGRTVGFEERQAQPDPKHGEFITLHYGEHVPDSATARTPSFVPRHVRALVTGLGGVFALVPAVVPAGVL